MTRTQARPPAGGMPRTRTVTQSTPSPAAGAANPTRRPGVTGQAETRDSGAAGGWQVCNSGESRAGPASQPPAAGPGLKRHRDRGELSQSRVTS